jgi:hypothetical protein
LRQLAVERVGADDAEAREIVKAFELLAVRKTRDAKVDAGVEDGDLLAAAVGFGDALGEAVDAHHRTRGQERLHWIGVGRQDFARRAVRRDLQTKAGVERDGGRVGDRQFLERRVRGRNLEKFA